MSMRDLFLSTFMTAHQQPTTREFCESILAREQQEQAEGERRDAVFELTLWFVAGLLAGISLTLLAVAAKVAA